MTFNELMAVLLALISACAGGIHARDEGCCWQVGAFLVGGCFGFVFGCFRWMAMDACDEIERRVSVRSSRLGPWLGFSGSLLAGALTLAWAALGPAWAAACLVSVR